MEAVEHPPAGCASGGRSARVAIPELQAELGANRANVNRGATHRCWLDPLKREGEGALLRSYRIQRPDLGGMRRAARGKTDRQGEYRNGDDCANRQ